MLIIQKFGGSSLADIDRLRASAEVCRRARRRGHDVIAVVSAMGDTTDELIELAQRINSSPSKRELDALMATGEQKSAALLAMTLESMGVPARSFTGWQAGLLTDPIHGEAEIDHISPERLYTALAAGQIPVVAGFQGISGAQDVTTLGRGGSDTTAVALCAAIAADRCEIYTDVDGVYTADPRLVKDAALLREIDCRDMLLLAKAGSQVLHSRSVELAMANGVELYIRPTLGDGEGSRVFFLPDDKRPPFAGVTRNALANEVTVVGRGVDGEIFNELYSLLEESGIGISAWRLGSGYVTVQVGACVLIEALRLAHSLAIK